MTLQPFVGPCLFFSFLIFYTVGRTPWTGDQPVARPLPAHRTAQTQNKRTQTSMPWVEFEPTNPAFERAKTVHALDRAAGHCDRQVMYLSHYIRELLPETRAVLIHVYKRKTWYVIRDTKWCLNFPIWDKYIKICFQNDFSCYINFNKFWEFVIKKRGEIQHALHLYVCVNNSWLFM
jgi:hypothetical protein